jgi:hypothetical protein
LIFPEIYLVRNVGFIRIYLSVEASVQLQNNRKLPCSYIERTPMGNAFDGIQFMSHVIQVALAERLYRNAL